MQATKQQTKETTAARPATPLPWHINREKLGTALRSERNEAAATALRSDNAAYIAHACNAYPKLVALLKLHVDYRDTRALAASLLRELGEAS